MKSETEIDISTKIDASQTIANDSYSWRQDFDSLMDNIAQGLARCEIVCDENNTPIDYYILSANEAFEKHTGLDRNIVVGKRILEVYPEMEKSWIETYGRVALTQKSETICGYNQNTKRHYRSTAYSNKPGEFMMLFEDITQQKELEKAHELVSKSTKLNSALIHNMIEGYKHGKVIFEKNNKPIDFKILEINEAYANIFGLKKEEVEGKTMLELFPTTDKEQIKSYCNVAITGESVSAINSCNVTNKVFDLSIFSPRRGEFVMFIKDITEREASRTELERANELVSKTTQLATSLIEKMPVGFKLCEAIYDDKEKAVDFKFLQVNAAYANQLGLNKNQIEGKTWKEVFPEVKREFTEYFGQVALTGEPVSLIDNREQTDRILDISAFSPKKGELAMFVKDITEREVERQELEEAYELVTKSTKINTDILVNMNDGFKHCEVICDEHGNPIDFKIITINNAYEKVTGLSANDIVGKTMKEVFPDIEKTWIETLGNVAITGESKNFVEYSHNTGKYYETSAYCPKKGEFGLFVKDVTEKEKARISLEQAYKKVEESERLKSAFFANMSHEIRTPLNAILGFSELLEEENLEKGEKQRCLKNIKNSGNRLLGIISNVLDISKLEANQEQLNYQVHNLNGLIDTLKDQFNLLKTNVNVQIVTSKALPNEKANISTDAIRLQQIFSNLLENSLKHTERGLIEFGYKVEGESLICFVSDTGNGIAKKDQEAIFKRFGQVGSNSQMNTGTGLGIPIAEGFTQLFGGKMWVESEIEKGSVFYFEIPYLPVDAENSLSKPNILVAEDEEANFMLLEMWMGKICNIFHAKDGNEAVEIVSNNPDIDLVLMDIKMPYVNGIDATKQIRKSNTTVPIIAQTAFVMDKEQQEILAAGCNEILTKPIKKNDFKILLEKYISV